MWPYPEKCEVSAAVDARDLQVAHHNFAVLVVLPKGAILLLQVRQRAQLILCTSTYWENKDRGITRVNATLISSCFI